MSDASTRQASVDLDRLEETVNSGEAARLAVTSALSVVQQADRQAEQARKVWADALAVASRHISYGEMAKLTGKGKAYLWRTAQSSPLHTGSDR